MLLSSSAGAALAGDGAAAGGVRLRQGGVQQQKGRVRPKTGGVSGRPGRLYRLGKAEAWRALPRVRLHGSPAPLPVAGGQPGFDSRGRRCAGRGGRKSAAGPDEALYGVGVRPEPPGGEGENPKRDLDAPV